MSLLRRVLYTSSSRKIRSQCALRLGGSKQRYSAVEEEVVLARKGLLASLFYDTTFKRAFLRNKENLHAFLSGMYEGEDVSILSIDNVEQKSASSRSIVYDIYCTLSDRSRVIVELQQADTKAHIVPRLVGYLSGDYSEQWQRGEKGYALTPVRVLALLGFKLDSDPDKSGSFLQRYRLGLVGNTSKPSVLLATQFRELVDLTVVQLPLAPSSFDDCKAESEKWGLLMLETSKRKTLYDIDRRFMEDKYMADVINSARIDNMSKSDFDNLVMDRKGEFDQMARIATAEIAERERDSAVESKEKALASAEKARLSTQEALASVEKERLSKEEALRKVSALEQKLADLCKSKGNE